jgi:hypothetical protein
MCREHAYDLGAVDSVNAQEYTNDLNESYTDE